MPPFELGVCEELDEKYRLLNEGTVVSKEPSLSI